MQLTKVIYAGLLAGMFTITGCGGGDINVSEGDVDNSVGDTTTNITNEGDGTTLPPPVVELGEESLSLSVAVSQALGQDVTVRTLSGTFFNDSSATSSNVNTGVKRNNVGEVITLTNDIVWALSGPVFIGNDKANSVTLEIEPGTIIFGRSGADYLVISRDSKIEATGTAEQPIIMTSYNDVIGGEVNAGQWGGLVILGNAPSTRCPQDDSNCSLQIEGAAEGAVFGGTDSEDNSGILNYLVVKYAGFEIAPDNELNGITFGGVGSGTTVDYVQVHANSDDGVEFFGGSVNAKHLVLHLDP
jgi:hypothetical protein